MTNPTMPDLNRMERTINRIERKIDRMPARTAQAKPVMTGGPK